MVFASKTVRVSKPVDGETIIAELGNARVEVATRGGNATKWRGCIPGDHVFGKLVKAAREHCAQ